MAEKKLNGGNSISKKTSLDTGQSILPHFRTSFASTNTIGSKPKRYSVSTAKPTSSPVAGPNSASTSSNSLEKTKSSENAKPTSLPNAIPNSTNTSKNIFPHYRTSFATCNVGGGTSNEGDVVPQKDSKKNSTTTEKKNSSSNLGNSFLPHYRTSFVACSVVANSKVSSAGKETLSSNNKENKTRPPLHVRASPRSCHDYCKHGLRGNEEKSRVPVTKRNIPRPPLKHNHDLNGISQDEKKKSVQFKPTYSSDSDNRSYKTRSCSFKSRPTIMEKPCVSSEVLNRLNEKKNNKLNTIASRRSPVGQNRSLNLSKCKSLKLNSPPRPQIIKQKSMYVPSRSCQEIETIIETGNENQNEIVVESPPPLLSSSESSSTHSNLLVCSSDDTLSESEYEYTDDESDYYVSEYTDEESLSETDEDTKRRIRGKIVENVGEDCTPIKFKSGKIVEKDNNENGPKRLKFRRGRTLESKEVENGPRRRIYRKIVGRVTKHKTSPKAENIELKHQELDEKKEQQVLLNEIIEETASKLAEERKSKVRALVGAFETVLIDSSPDTPTKA